MKFLNEDKLQSIHSRLQRLYGNQATELMSRFRSTLGRYGVGNDVVRKDKLWDENDVALITYADTIRAEDSSPLATLHEFLLKRAKGAISTVHLLPFYPWSSDDGFSVIDYRQVDPNSGSWQDVQRLGKDFELMFDLVLNHCSSQSQWFKDFVTGIAPARFYFHTLDPKTDLRQVVRPRPWPLLTKTTTKEGEVWVWTTFSADQVDLNWANPDVLFEFIDILFQYIAKGVRILRLDAVAFLWKEVGTSCIHLPQTHEVVKLFRDILELVAPHVILLTETNVPHEENISYLGQGDEAHMVYNFSLPPLILHALLRNDARHLTRWASSLPALGNQQTYLNFTASHDGIGVRPLQGLLEPAELDWLVDQVRSKGGRISMKSNPDGSESPYELNISYVSALGIPEQSELGMARLLCSQAIMLAFQGIPAVYIQNLLGTPNWEAGMERPDAHNRTINRRKWQLQELNSILDDETHIQSRIFRKYLQFLRRRSHHAAFHPSGKQAILDLGQSLFCLVRTSPNGDETVICVFNVTEAEQKIPLRELHPAFENTGSCRDLLNANTLKTGPRRHLVLAPYHAYWLAVR